jgi:hypothetical protein
MSFLSQVFSAHKTENVIYDKNRRKTRYKCAINTKLTDSNGNVWSCKIVNMSETGIGISTAAPLLIGSCVSIVQPSITGEVVWLKDNKVGIRPTK